MKVFTYSKPRSQSVVVTESEENAVNEVLGSFTTKKAAIEYLVKRGWSTKQICQKISYDDGRPLREQHVNQVRSRRVVK